MMKVKFGLIVQNLEMAETFGNTGLDSLWVLDHFHPITHTIGLYKPEACKSALVDLPLVLSRTKCTVGTSVLCPLFRYSPAIIGQYFAQLDSLYPNRVILGIGTGESQNEVPFHGSWPPYEERRDRLVEAVELIRKLWTSRDYFDYNGKYYKLHNALLYLKPSAIIPILIAARGPKSANLAGKIGDGILITGVGCGDYYASPEMVKSTILPNFAKGAREAGKNPDKMSKAIWFWTGLATDPMKLVSALGPPLAYWHGTVKAVDEPDPRRVEEITKDFPVDEILKTVPIFFNTDDLIKRLESYIQAGVTEIILDDLTPVSKSLGISPPDGDRLWERILTHFRA